MGFVRPSFAEHREAPHVKVSCPPPMPLQQLHDDVWVQPAPQTMLGLHLGTRMTVVRLPNGDLWVHSPIPLDEALQQELRALGPVRHVVAPNMYHHLHAGPMAAAFDDTVVHARPGLRKKRKDLRIDADLTGDTPSDWQGTLTCYEIGGTWLDEVAFHHHPSNLLISCDLVQNYTACPHLLTRLYLWLGGAYKKPALERFTRFMFRDRVKARAGIDALLAVNFGGIVLSHGDVIEEGGPDILAASYTWLRPRANLRLTR